MSQYIKSDVLRFVDMQMKAGLTFACLNLKKLAKMKDKMGLFMNCCKQLLSFFVEKECYA